ncbi:La-related protein 6 [Halocaridina rubra]|uniref:La-related protein 6 n=1 Tax=Halocaridina rubra TaxID=373956 RepID=A0AAN9A035_HALRR
MTSWKCLRLLFFGLILYHSSSAQIRKLAMLEDQELSVGSVDSGMGENLVASLDKLLLDDKESISFKHADAAEIKKPSREKVVIVAPIHPVKVRAMSNSSEETGPLGGEDIDERLTGFKTKEERIALLKELLETYFSDNYLTRDIFLLKHFRKSKEGWISLKFIASYKKIKRTAKNKSEVEEAVALSSLLEISDDGTKIRRLAKFPACIETYIPTRMTLIGALPTPMRSLATLSNFLSHYGDVASLQILRPGVNLPDILWETANSFPELRDQWCAVVEFDEIESAGKLASDVNEGKSDSNIAWALELVMPWKSRKNSDRQEKTLWTEPIRNRCRSCPSSGYSSPCHTPEQSPRGRHHDNRGLSKRERIMMNRHVCQGTCFQHIHCPTTCCPNHRNYSRVPKQNGYRSPKLSSSKLTAETCDNWRRVSVSP